MALPLTYKNGNCYINAYINKSNYYKDKALKLVIGSLGINGWFEFGGKHWTKADFAAKVRGYITDSHCWLEDAEGNVYDFLFEDYNHWVRIRTKSSMKRTGLLEGVSKAELAAAGIEYVAAPIDAQLMLAAAVGPHMRTAAEQLKTGECVWNGDYLAYDTTDLSVVLEALRSGRTASGAPLAGVV